MRGKYFKINHLLKQLAMCNFCHIRNVMKIPVLLVAVIMTVFSSFARITLEDISPHFSTNTEIIWDVPTNALPKSFWVYKKLPHIFSATTISNAVVLASFQSKGSHGATGHSDSFVRGHALAQKIILQPWIWRSWLYARL